MKKIIFCLQTMVCGGVEKELITVLRKFDPREYDLTVLLFYEQDKDIQSSIPDFVRVEVLNIDQAYYCSKTRALAAKRFRKGHAGEALRILTNRLVKGIPAAATMDLSALPELPDFYDYAVCYHMHSSVMMRYVAEKIHAGRKYVWIHNEFASTRYRIEKYGKWLEQYDRIVGVSTQLADEFKERCPQLAERVVTVHNIVDIEDICAKATLLDDVDEVFLQEERFRIVTVGRFVGQKGFDLAIRAARQLKDRGGRFCWFAIGYGSEEENMRALIRELDVQDVFVILGRKDNPYPYMAKADLYVQPSRHEGFGITVTEAKVLYRPIICTNFAGALDQIQNGVNGYILNEVSVEAIAQEVFALYTSQETRDSLMNALHNEAWEKGFERIEAMFKEL